MSRRIRKITKFEKALQKLHKKLEKENNKEKRAKLKSLVKTKEKEVVDYIKDIHAA